ncbi:class I SAM-dependent methyltransferase [Melittangium boletus]|uniref:class I SAM-dependent methyltransferase n=1 Tax=Melittangium boletus TaxID=83453 RepID=UPI003DA5A10F
MLNPDGHEISDLIVDYDPVSLERRRVRRDEVVATLQAQGMRWGAWVAAGLPERDGWLDEVEVDALLVRVHAEMQRLWEEFLQGERVRALLVPLLAALREHGHQGPVRVVDVGCGLGYLVRWLAARGRLGDDVELIGCDYNRALIDAARHHAAAEGLQCAFHVANAFTLEEPATVFLSTGVLHHFRGPGLERFFAEQRRAAAFIHIDIKPSYLAPVGSLVFHLARMREPVARHDGTQSAVRAHAGASLLAAARAGAPELRVALFDGAVSAVPLTRTLHAVVGMTPSLEAAFRRGLGPLAARLGGTS